MIDSPLQQETIDWGDSSLDASDARVVGLTLLQHPDLARVGQISALFSSQVGGLRRISRLEPEFREHACARGTPLSAPTLSRNPILVRSSARGGLCIENPGALGRVSVAGQPLLQLREVEAAELERGIVLELSGCVLLLLHYLDPDPDPAASAGPFGESLGIRRVREQIRRVADLDTGVLIRGETGSGKELVAEAIHAASRRSERPLVVVNMAAIPATMGAAALFGHVRGAFTGATHAAPGYFGQAHGGTLFLDEIGETTPEVQPLLLRALREGQIQPVGQAHSEHVDVRVLSATDADLEARVARGQFSLPLLKRLDGYTLRVPPLRQRRDDLGRLFFHFLRRELGLLGELHKLAEPEPQRKPWLPLGVLADLLERDWPGNVAELESVVRRIAYDNRGRERFVFGEWQSEARQSRPARGESAGASAPGDAALQQSPKRGASSLSDQEVVGSLRQHQFSIKAAARALGVSRSWLSYRMQECEGMRKAKELEAQEILAIAGDGSWNWAEMARKLEVSEHGLKLRVQALGLTPRRARDRAKPRAS